MDAGEKRDVQAEALMDAADTPQQPRRVARARRADQHAKPAWFATIFTAFLALVAAALMAGGHSVIDPLLQAAAAAREAKQVGEIVVSMPDGRFCRHFSFDNATAEVRGDGLQPCPADLRGRGRTAPAGFAWGAR